MSEHTEDTAAIERDLRATRARLDSRLSELSQRLSPGQIVDEALHYMRSSGGADFTRNLAETVRDRPLPVVLAALGIGWLMMAGPRPPERVVYREGWVNRGPYRSGLGDESRNLGDDGSASAILDDFNSGHSVLARRAWDAGRAVTRTEGESDTDFRSRVAEARATVLGVTRQAQETGHAFADRVEEALFTARDAVTDSAQGAAGWVGDTARGMRDAAGESMRGAANWVGDTARSARDTAGWVGDSARGMRDAASGSMQGAAAWVGDSARGLRDTAAGVGDAISRQSSRLGDAASAGYDRARAAAGFGADMCSMVANSPVLMGSLGLLTGAVLGALLPTTETEREYLGETANSARQAVQGAAQQAMDRGLQVAQGAMDAAVHAGRKVADEVDRKAREMPGDGACAPSAPTA
jgi:hypothetical protein